MTSAPSTALRRTSAVFRAGLAGTWARGSWPVGPLVMHGSLSALLCGLVNDVLPPYAYALFALVLAAATLALPLLGEFGVLLRADHAADWIEAQPVTKVELRVARLLLVATWLFALSTAALVPAAILAPSEMDLGARAVLFAAGLAQAVVVAAVLLALQSALGERAEALLVLVQTVLVAFVVTGLVFVPRVVPYAHEWHAPDELPALARALPAAWFASTVLPIAGGWTTAALAATIVALLVLLAAPFPPPPRARRTRTWMELVLRPVRAIATRGWVRREERGSFDLVWDALPLEREFVLRTYPMFGIPIAFLLAGASDESGRMREALLSLLLFTTPVYLPILLAHVPATSSPDARWILETAPVSRADVRGGALKAVALRFLFPLYALLFALAWYEVDLLFALRLALPAALVCTIVLRRIFPMFSADPPLSIRAEDVTMPMDWTGPFLGIAIGLVFVSIAAWAWITTWWASLLVCAALLAVDRSIEKHDRTLVEPLP